MGKSKDYLVRAVEIEAETVQLLVVEEPRVTSGGRPVGITRIITFDRGDEALAPIIEDLVTTLSDFADDLLAATSEERTQSLTEFEEDLTDLDDDLGMGDSRDDIDGGVNR